MTGWYGTNVGGEYVCLNPDKPKAELWGYAYDYPYGYKLF